MEQIYKPVESMLPSLLPAERLDETWRAKENVKTESIVGPMLPDKDRTLSAFGLPILDWDESRALNNSISGSNSLECPDNTNVNDHNLILFY